jgi:uncharacterized protein (DUF433 family)
MKQTALFLLLIPLLVTMVGAPVVVSAKYDDDDDKYESRDDRDDDDNDEDEDEDEDREDDELEIEADIFTDITIVKVEIDDKKSLFSTEADTRDEVIAVIAEKFGLTEAEVDAALELETEDRASRPQDRGKLNREMKKEKYEEKKQKWWGNYSSSTPKVCRDDDDTLEIEADVFTDKTVVKVEFVNAKDEVFTTSATTSAGVVDAVAAKYSSLTKSAIGAALDFEVEDRASRDSDLVVDNDCKNWSKPASTTTPVVNEAKLKELQARIVELQNLLNRLLGLMRGN